MDNSDDPISAELATEGFARQSAEELPEAAYHLRPEWSCTALKLLPDEPELFHGRHVLNLPDWQFEPTKYTNLGTAAHGAILQGHKIPIIPADVLTSNGQRRGKPWDQFAANHAGETWLKADEAEPVKWMTKAIYDTPKAKALLALPGEAETAVFWRDEKTGLSLRSRLDKLVVMGDKALILDLKCTSDSSPEKFSWKCLDMGYHYQAAMYMWGCREVLKIEPTAFVFIVVEYQPPYRCFTYEVCDEMLNLGWMRVGEALSDLKTRLESNNWSRPDRNRLLRLNLPKTAYFQAN